LRSDAELILASAGDPFAFRELYDRWAETLLAYLYRRVVNAEVATDLLAETFAVAFERRVRALETSDVRAARGCTGSPASSSPTTSAASTSSC
jgi:RNA polymerase sigma-70 factor (ECF subfamily)